MQAWDKLLENKQHKPRYYRFEIKLVEDVQKINEDLADYVNCPGFNRELVSSYDDDDGDNTSNDEEEFKISSNPLYDLDEVSPINEEVLEKTNSIPPGIEISCFNSESDLLESLLNRDSSNDSSQKIRFTS
ncbi:hypothetical protein Tco_0389360 [Tanacetum coccineum]